MDFWWDLFIPCLYSFHTYKSFFLMTAFFLEKDERLPDMNQERKAKVKHRKTIMAF